VPITTRVVGLLAVVRSVCPKATRRPSGETANRCETPFASRRADTSVTLQSSSRRFPWARPMYPRGVSTGAWYGAVEDGQRATVTPRPSLTAMILPSTNKCRPRVASFSLRGEAVTGIEGAGRSSAPGASAGAEHEVTRSARTAPTQSERRLPPLAGGGPSACPGMGTGFTCRGAPTESFPSPSILRGRQRNPTYETTGSRQGFPRPTPLEILTWRRKSSSSGRPAPWWRPGGRSPSKISRGERTGGEFSTEGASRAA
jgi:hypothetical protein